MVLVIIIAAIILLLVVSVYQERKDRITAEELPKVIKEMIDHGKKISVLKQETIYSPEEEEYIVKGLEMAWAYEGAKTYRELLIKYRELERGLNGKRFDRMLKRLGGEERIKREFRKSLKEKIDDIKVIYPEIYYKCFKNEDESNEYIERLVKKL
ncbi:hypothetical protein [Clostridium perfringens]|uniref:hypothetical protein n=1 Tax=Clostridium perfringens TaxID=1502 RepID=UPI00189700F1|nr:hypothetical protein [Clostridium perfringens]